MDNEGNLEKLKFRPGIPILESLQFHTTLPGEDVQDVVIIL